MRRVLITAGLALLVLQGCSLRLQGAPSEREFFRKLETQPAYVADPARADAILSGVRQINICSRAKDVRRLMGEPDYGSVAYDTNGNHDAVIWSYVLDAEPAGGGPMHAVAITVNASRYVICIVTLTDSEFFFSLVDDGPGCHSR